MKRWNKKGSFHAHQRMAELRHQKERLATTALIRAFNIRFGVQTFDDWKLVSVERGWTSDMSETDKQAWFTAQLESPA